MDNTRTRNGSKSRRGPYSAGKFDLSLITDEDRIWFWSLFGTREPGACWVWPRGCSKFGHGKLHFYGHALLAHRLAWMMEFGAIPVGKVVRHSCDNPPCCNPAHLPLGSQARNGRDAAIRGRTRTGKLRRLNQVQSAPIRSELEPV